jgi:hypothetical protein
MKTAVEWLVEQFKGKRIDVDLDWNIKLIEKAKEMEKKQSQKMYSEMQVYQIIELIRLTGESPEFIMEQLKKPIHKNQNLNTNNI